jgi:hypothetical protein
VPGHCPDRLRAAWGHRAEGPAADAVPLVVLPLGSTRPFIRLPRQPVSPRARVASALAGNRSTWTPARRHGCGCGGHAEPLLREHCPRRVRGLDRASGRGKGRSPQAARTGHLTGHPGAPCRVERGVDSPHAQYSNPIGGVAWRRCCAGRSFERALGTWEGWQNG